VLLQDVQGVACRQESVLTSTNLRGEQWQCLSLRIQKVSLPVLLRRRGRVCWRGWRRRVSCLQALCSEWGPPPLGTDHTCRNNTSGHCPVCSDTNHTKYVQNHEQCQIHRLPLTYCVNRLMLQFCVHQSSI